MPDKVAQAESAGGSSTQTGEASNDFAPEHATVTAAGRRSPGRRLFLRLLVIGFVLALLGGMGYLAYIFIFKEKPKAFAQQASQAPVVTVTTAAAQIRQIDDILSVTGSVSAWDELKIGAEVGGLRIRSVEVEEGDLVKKGQVLARLNSDLLETQLAQARAKLESSEANLVKAVQPNRPEEISVLKLLLAAAQDAVTQEEAHERQSKVKLDNAELNAERCKYLVSQGAKSDEELEAKMLERDNAALELVSAQHKVAAARRAAEQAGERLEAARKGGRHEDIAISKAGLNETRALVKQLGVQLKQTVITAPDDGLISKCDAHIGDTAEPSRALFTMVRLNRLELRAQVNDTDLSKFKPGQSVAISTSESEKGTVIGKVRRVSPEVDPSSRLGTVRIDLPVNCGLKPGMFVRGETKLASYRTLTVPLGCLVTRGGESSVFMLDGKRALNTPVEIGVQTESLVEIKKGLKEGQLVVEKGARFLSDRDIVDVGK